MNQAEARAVLGPHIQGGRFILPLAHIAEQTGIPRETLKYWRSKLFPEILPCKPQGKTELNWVHVMMDDCGLPVKYRVINQPQLSCPKCHSKAVDKDPHYFAGAYLVDEFCYICGWRIPLI